MNYKEIEFKYNATGVSLDAFTRLCQEHGEYTSVMPAGYDYFYQNEKDPDSFLRHRVGAKTNQLTFKRKTTDKNNFVRTEHNIDLTKSMTRPQLEAFCGEFGYKYAFAIYKNAFVYLYDRYNFVYYICYDTDMRELGRFIEIEMKEDYDWKTEEEAYEALLKLEQTLKAIGITPQARIKRSLFEMFSK